MADQPVVRVSTAGKVSTTPKALGLRVDVPATVDGLVGFSLSPATMGSHLAGHHPRRPGRHVLRRRHLAGVDGDLQRRLLLRDALGAWTPHSYDVSRYSEGREATSSWPDLHHKFTNTTDGGVLIQVTTTSASITVTFWGTRKFDVTAPKSPRYDVVQPKKFSDPGPGCLDQNPVPGFRVDVGRITKQGGKVVKTEKFTTSYRPEDDVTCTNPQW